MYVKDGIAYAENQEKSIKVLSVRPLKNYKLWLRFSTGEERVFDCTKLLEFPAFQRLKDIKTFNGVYIDYGIPVWCDGEIDYCPYALYAESELMPSACL